MALSFRLHRFATSQNVFSGSDRVIENRISSFNLGWRSRREWAWKRRGTRGRA
jgi:hypothetical protein